MTQLLCRGYPQMGREKPSWLTKASSPLWELKDAPSKKKKEIKKKIKPTQASYLCTFRWKVIHTSVRRFPMTNSGWIAWSQAMQFLGICPCRRLPASQISTPKLSLVFTCILPFLILDGSYLVPCLHYIYWSSCLEQDCSSKPFFFMHMQIYLMSIGKKRAFQPQYHWDNAVLSSGLQLNARSILSH